jgi:hypothetical protein
MFVLRSTPHDYFQPVIVISAGLHALGVAAWLALLLWKPVAVGVALLAVRAYVRRTLAARFDRLAALTLALFFASFGVLGDEWLPFWTWGYPFGLLAIAAVVAGLISYDRARAEGRFTWMAPILGLAASFTHPWQGELLILIVIGAELATWKRGEDLRRLAQPAATVIATALPLVYYEALYRLDPAWHAAQQASRHEYSLSGIIVPLVPLMIAAALAYRRRPRTFLDAATRAWPFAALAIFGLSQTGISGTPLHAFDGITIPLAVLAVEGVQSIGFRRIPAWRFIAIAVVAAGVIPGSISQLQTANFWAKPEGHNANFVYTDERRALDYLASDRQPGGVLARATYLGLIIPAETGRRTYVGGCLWSEPNCAARIINTRDLFLGSLKPADARSYVRSTGARFLLKDCYSPEVVPKLLGSMVVRTNRFGCASVYQLSTSH